MLRSFLVAGALSFVALCSNNTLLAQTQQQSIPRTLSYQGVLTEPNGTLLQDGIYSITVRLYDNLNAENPIYSESHNVTVVRGLFNILIGSQFAIPKTIAFDRAYFLGVSVNNADEMKPRTPLTASPYALRAESSAKADVATVAESLAPNAKAVQSLNTITGNVTLKGGDGIRLDQAGSEITINSTTPSTNSKGDKLQGTYAFTGDLSGTASTVMNWGNWLVRIAQNGATNGQTLVWNSATSRWMPGNAGAAGNAGGSLTGTYPNPTIAANAVGTTQIANSAVTDAKVASGISASKISGDISGNSANVTGTVAIANGGTGATTASGARTNLGLGSLATQNSVGDANITDVAGSKVTGDISGNSANVTGTVALANGGTGATTASGARTNLGLGSLATQNTVGTTDINDGAVTDAKVASGISASKISGDISGNSANVTGTVALANGGTGATSASGARTNLGLGSLATLNSVGDANITDVAGSKVTGNISGNSANVTGTVALANGGTGATTAGAALNNLLPSQSGQSGKVLQTDGSNASWQTAGSSVTMSGTTNNFLLKQTATNTIGNSLIQDNGTTVTIGTALGSSTLYQLNVNRSQSTINGDGQHTLYGYRTRDSQNDGTSYAQISANTATTGFNFWGDVYTFGVGGWSYNDYNRTGGVLGADVNGTYWGSLGYRASTLLNYGVYGSSAYTSGGGYMENKTITGIGGGFAGGIIGSWSRGMVIGNVTSGELVAQYNVGNVLTSGYTADVMTIGATRVPAYSVTSPELSVYAHGSAVTATETMFVPFSPTYQAMLGDVPDVTISPIGSPAQMYLVSVEKHGFTVAVVTASNPQSGPVVTKDNSSSSDIIANGGSAVVSTTLGDIKPSNSGAPLQSPIKFSWIAVGKRMDANTIAPLPTEIANTNFDNTMNEVMFDDNNKEQSGKSIWWDGQRIRFDKAPEAPKPPKVEPKLK